MILAKIITITGITLSLGAYANGDIKTVTAVPEIQPYVVGGVDSKELELPWQVYLEIKKNGDTFACGGTLITDTWVVTAAHCLNGDDLVFVPVNTNQVTVYSGDIDRSFRGSMSNNVVTTLIVHPKYDQSANTADIALLELSSPVLSPAQPIKLMDNTLQVDADIEFDAAIHDNLILSGWGRTSTDSKQSTNILQKAAVSGVSDSYCTLAWGRTISAASFICANAYDRGSCSGDSGGPLIWQDKSSQGDNDLGYRLAGVVSFGNSKQCALNSLPDVYTQVSTYNGWIIDEINEEGGYTEPNSSFTQDIFSIEENPLPVVQKRGGIGYSFLLLLTGLLLYRRNNRN